MGECNLVLRPNLIPYHNFVDVVELVPVLIILKLVSVQRLELWASRDCDIECFGCVKTLLIE